ncbi:MAG: DUF1501 domain-containing protein, partial [Cyclobacteriaceae bacterium]|nr:DUF1501 domain-containing protein [Cyclobacteriaceae bacterium]
MCHHHEVLKSDNKDFQQIEKQIDRRQFLTKTSLGLGAMALGSLLGTENLFAASGNPISGSNGIPGLPHFSPKVKRIVYLFQSGGPSQLETYDYKPK